MGRIIEVGKMYDSPDPLLTTESIANQISSGNYALSVRTQQFKAGEKVQVK